MIATGPKIAKFIKNYYLNKSQWGQCSDPPFVFDYSLLKFCSSTSKKGCSHTTGTFLLTHIIEQR